jgi:hypothetical protein
VDQPERPDDRRVGAGASAIPVARVAAPADLVMALDGLGLRRGRPVLVLVGGAAGMTNDHLESLRCVLRDVALPLVQRLDAVVVDGGTDSGVMRAIGRARRECRAVFPLVGVVAEGTVVLPGVTGHGPDTADLEPHHTHFVLVPGSEWGDESPWLDEVADAVADGARSATLVVNGGQITFVDAATSIARGRQLIVLDGTGRTADAIALARTDPGEDPQASAIAAAELTTIVAFDDAEAIRSALEEALVPG